MDVFIDTFLVISYLPITFWWALPANASPFKTGGSWDSYQIGKSARYACAGNAGNVFPTTDVKRKPLVSDPGMHHSTCVTHVPWYMSRSRTRGGGENILGIPGACATHNSVYLARGPWPSGYQSGHCSGWRKLFRRVRDPITTSWWNSLIIGISTYSCAQRHIIMSPS